MEYSASFRREKRLEIWLLLFFLTSTAGWVWEVLLTACATGQWVNRGMLHGPWLPVYGVGGLLLTAAAWRGRRGLSPLLTGAAIGSAVEYTAGWALEALYHRRWWDYTGFAGSVRGRVCLASAAGFALAGWLAARTAPFFLNRFSQLRDNVRKTVCRSVSLVYALDWTVSLLLPNTGAGVSGPL